MNLRAWSTFRVIALGPLEQKPLDEISSRATLLRHEPGTLGTRSRLLEHAGQFRIEGVIRQDERLPGHVRMGLLAGAAICDVADLEKNLAASCRWPSAGVTYPQFTLWRPKPIVGIGAI